MKDKARITFGQNLKRLMELKGFNQSQMGKIAGVGQKTISNLVNPDRQISPNLETIAKVAAYFKIHPGILIMADLTDDSLTDSEVSIMLERFAQLPPEHKRRIMDLIGDYWHMNQQPG